MAYVDRPASELDPHMGVRYALWNDFSVAVIRGAIEDLPRFRSISDLNIPPALLGEFVDLVAINEEMEVWGAAYNRDTRLLDGASIRGSSTNHIDSEFDALVMSFAVNKPANWQAQILRPPSGTMVENTILLGGAFDKEKEVDVFVQEPGDLVIVPEMTIHSIDAEQSRQARVFRYSNLNKAATLQSLCDIYDLSMLPPDTDPSAGLSR